MTTFFPAFENPKRFRDEIGEDVGVSGVGSLKSFYEEGVESEKIIKKLKPLHNPTEGPLNLFPMLDVMRGAATSENQAFPQVYGLKATMDFPRIDVAALLYEETLGKLHGYRQNNDIMYKEEATSSCTIHEGVIDIEGHDVDQHAGQSKFGMHEISEKVEAQAKAVAEQHNVGDQQMARKHGFQRADNPAINDGNAKKGDELVYENSKDLPLNAPCATPMEVDVIEVNGQPVTVESTMEALDGNV